MSKKYSILSREEKLCIVERFLSSGQSLHRFSKENSLITSNLWKWIRIFVPDWESPIQLINKNEVSLNDPSEMKDYKSENKELRSALHRLKLQLEREKMRADFHEVLVDIAKEHYNIDLRKKANARQ